MFYFEDEISTFQVHKRQTRQYHIWEKEIRYLILRVTSFCILKVYQKSGLRFYKQTLTSWKFKNFVIM